MIRPLDTIDDIVTTSMFPPLRRQTIFLFETVSFFKAARVGTSKDDT